MKTRPNLVRHGEIKLLSIKFESTGSSLQREGLATTETVVSGFSVTCKRCVPGDGSESVIPAVLEVSNLRFVVEFVTREAQ